MPTLQVVIASTRPGRKGPAVAAWFRDVAAAHGGFDVELVDLAELGLPVFDEEKHPRFAQYEREHTKRWATTVARADAFVLVTPEYNYFAPPSVINAFDYLSREWFYKPMGFVSYGGVSGGLRGVQTIKLAATSLKIVPIPEAVVFPMFSRWLDESGRFQPEDAATTAAGAMLDELRRWSDALAPLRAR